MCHKRSSGSPLLAMKGKGPVAHPATPHCAAAVSTPAECVSPNLINVNVASEQK